MGLTTMLNILITGSNGQLGSELQTLQEHFNALNATTFFTDRETLDITNKELVQNFCTQNNITHIISCAAYTAVDKAEEDQENADRVNYLAVKNLAEVAWDQGVSLIHISTDYVFDGKNYKPYTEDDPTNPQGVYGVTKLAGEQAMQQINPKNSIIIRIKCLPLSRPNPNLL